MLITNELAQSTAPRHVSRAAPLDVAHTSNSLAGRVALYLAGMLLSIGDTPDIPARYFQRAQSLYALCHASAYAEGIHSDVIDYGDKGCLPSGVIRPKGYSYVRLWKNVAGITSPTDASPPQILEGERTRSMYVLIPPQRGDYGSYIIPSVGRMMEFGRGLFDPLSGLPYETTASRDTALQRWQKAGLLGKVAVDDAFPKIPRFFHGMENDCVVITTISGGPIGMGIATNLSVNGDFGLRGTYPVQKDAALVHPSHGRVGPTK